MSAFRPRILIIDDDAQIHRFLRPAFEAAGYEPFSATTAEDGLRVIARSAPDAVLLDLGLPDIDGKTALSMARSFFSGVIIILSAREREAEKIAALDLGADDYVQKPFGVGELLARLRVAMRSRLLAVATLPVVKIGDLTIDLVNRNVTRNETAIRLSPKEYDLLARLVEGGGKVLSHKALLAAVWGPAHLHDVQYLRVFVSQLRQKLEVDATSPRIITTELGIGYRFIADAS